MSEEEVMEKPATLYFLGMNFYFIGFLLLSAPVETMGFLATIIWGYATESRLCLYPYVFTCAIGQEYVSLWLSLWRERQKKGVA